MNKLIVLVGISGSGKSTFATNYIKEHPNTLRINRDSIRKTLVGSLDGYYQRKDLNNIEQIVNDLTAQYINILYGEKKDIILDNTNLKQSYIKQYIDKDHPSAYNKVFDVKFKLFDISLEEAKDGVSAREFDEEYRRLHDSDRIKLDYIDKQFEQYKQIKQYLETNHKDQII